MRWRYSNQRRFSAIDLRNPKQVGVQPSHENLKPENLRNPATPAPARATGTITPRRSDAARGRAAPSLWGRAYISDVSYILTHQINIYIATFFF